MATLMSTLIISNSASSTLALTHNHKSPPRSLFNSPHVSNSRSFRFSVELGRRRRPLSVVTRAGPSTNVLIFAFVLPLSLLAVTIFTSIRIADRLDKKFLEEMAINEAILELDEEDDDVDVGLSLDKEPALPRARNRPKREA